jgi:hypothetical protein
MDENSSTDDKVQFSLSISVDRDHFMRRTCPSCGRDFKTKVDGGDLAWAMSSQIRRMGLDIGAKPAGETEDAAKTLLRCPYCEHQAEASDMLTEETVNYLQRFALREYLLPMVNNMFSGLEDSFGNSGGGFISVSFKHSRSILPPRPIHGPEPPDMKIVELLCCGEKIKIAEKWYDLQTCSFCGTPVALI